MFSTSAQLGFRFTTPALTCAPTKEFITSVDDTITLVDFDSSTCQAEIVDLQGLFVCFLCLFRFLAVRFSHSFS